MDPLQVASIAGYTAGVVVIATGASDRLPEPLVWVFVLGAPVAVGYAAGNLWVVALALLWPALGWIGESDDVPGWLTAALQLAPLSAALLLGGVLLRWRSEAGR